MHISNLFRYLFDLQSSHEAKELTSNADDDAEITSPAPLGMIIILPNTYYLK